jgi:hypothetical protein
LTAHTPPSVAKQQADVTTITDDTKPSAASHPSAA